MGTKHPAGKSDPNDTDSILVPGHLYKWLKTLLFDEFLFWVSVSIALATCLYFLRAPLEYFLYGPTRDGYTSANFVLVYAPSILIIFGIISFKLVFEKLPLESLSERIKNRRRPTRYRAECPRSTDSAEPRGFTDVNANRPDSGQELCELYASRSATLANSLFSRAKVYLFVGVVIAFSGLLFFFVYNQYLSASARTGTSIYSNSSNIAQTPAGPYTRSSKGDSSNGANPEPVLENIEGATLSPETPNGSVGEQKKHVNTVGIELLLAIASLLPGFGILFFLEFVAFFFLRQYRSAMDDFRHYNAIQRRREELCAALLLAKEQGNELAPIELIKENAFFSTAGILVNGETTEILETRKLEKDELELFQKIVELIGKQK